MTAELLCNDALLAADRSLAARHVAGFRRNGTSALIANAACEVMLLRCGDARLPVTVDDGARGRSYVSSPHSAYVLYARDEVALLGLGHRQRLADGALGTLDLLLRGIEINRAVHIDNWLLSTNLHGDWKGAGLVAMRETLASRFPEHVLILRSLDPWSCPELLAAAREDGWTLLPARQVWVTDDLARDWQPRNNCANDRRALNRSGLTIEDPVTLSEADATCIAALYQQLYVGRYSAINPVFSTRFIEFSARTGLLRYRLARGPEGDIRIAMGLREAGGILTVPLLGYDLARPQSEGLYRIASYLFAQWALDHGLRLHGSAGASQFKRNRGAHGVIEYMAVDARHLSRGRRAGLAVLAAGLQRVMAPMLRRQGW